MIERDTLPLVFTKPLRVDDDDLDDEDDFEDEDADADDEDEDDEEDDDDEPETWQVFVRRRDSAKGWLLLDFGGLNCLDWPGFSSSARAGTDSAGCVRRLSS